MRLQDVPLHRVVEFGDAYDWRDWLGYQIASHFGDFMLERGEFVTERSDCNNLHLIYNFLRDISAGHRVRLGDITVGTLTKVADWYVLSPQQLIAALVRRNLDPLVVKLRGLKW